MIHAEPFLIGLMLLNGCLSIPFGVLAKRSFTKNGNLTPFLAAWSGVAMHGHALMTFAIAWVNRGTLYTPQTWTVISGLLVLGVGAYIIYLGRKAYGDQSRVYGLKEDALIRGRDCLRINLGLCLRRRVCAHGACRDYES